MSELQSKREQVRLTKISPDEERLFLEKFHETADTMEGLIAEQPGAGETDLLVDWFHKMQSLYTTLSYQTARAEGLFNLSQYQAIANNEIPEADWKHIGRSSTLTTNYVAGLYWDRYVAWQRLVNLTKVVEAVFNNTRTLIATIRTEKEIGLRNVNQNIPSDGNR